MDRDNNIGTLRFIGALMVLFSHGYVLLDPKQFDPLSAALMPYAPFNKFIGGQGVLLFFALSGYLVTASFNRKKSLRYFIVSRVLRIYPGAIVAVLFCVFIIGLGVTSESPESYLSSAETWSYLRYNISLIDTYFTLPGVFNSLPYQSGINGSLWTLPVELYMYFLVACVGLFGFFHNRIIFNLFTMGAVLIYISNPAPFILLPPRYNHPHLALAFLLGSFFYNNRKYIYYNSTGMLTCIIIAGVSWQTKCYDFFSLIAFVYFIFWIAFSSIKLPRLDHYGDFSYGLYLYAFPIQQLIIYFGVRDPLFLNVLSCFISICCAIFSWYFVEQPALKTRENVIEYISKIHKFLT